MDPAAVRARVDGHVRRHDLIPRGGAVTCLVSGGADSGCLWHVLSQLAYVVSALHVNHGLRGADSEADARLCRDLMGAEVVDAPPASSEADLREIRYSYARDRLRATGHTATDQAETVLYRLVASGSTRGIKVRREDGVVRPLLPLTREETHAYCRLEGVPFRTDATNAETKRGLIRDEIMPRLRALHPAAEQNLAALATERARLPRQLEDALLSLLASRDGSKRIDLGSGLQAVREYDSVWVERGPVRLSAAVRWGPWTIESELEGLHVRGWRAGDRLAGRAKKVQDVFVDAKIARSEREAWPLVVRGDEVVAIPGLVDAAGVRAWREDA